MSGRAGQPTWQTADGSIRLYLADCLTVLPQLEAGSVDAVVTDPPYAIPTLVASGRFNSRSVGDLSLIEATFRRVFRDWSRIIKPTGRAFIFCDGTSYPVVFRAAYSDWSTALLVWAKGRIGMGREFRKSHELILHCWQNETPVFSDGNGRADVLTFDPVGDDREHGAQKPVELIEHLLTVCGDVVCDPFMGSGTTALACIQTGRRFVGYEIEPRYFEIAVKRIEAELSRNALFEPPPKVIQRTLLGDDAA